MGKPWWNKAYLCALVAGRVATGIVLLKLLHWMEDRDDRQKVK
jgi:hypothetical protein